MLRTNIAPENLVKDKDYTVRYSNNYLPTVNALVTITGRGNYTGTIELNFKITSAKITYERPMNITTVYTGYPTNGLTSEQQNSYIKVTTPTQSNVAYSSELPKCQNGTYACSDDEKIYDSTIVPKFTNVGVHTVWYKITATGYETIFGTFTIKITPKKLPVPSVYGDYIYTGLVQSPSWINYNSKFMNMSGQTTGVQANTYSVKFDLTDPNVEWIDSAGSSDRSRIVNWTIQNLSIKDHEEVQETFIKYGE